MNMWKMNNVFNIKVTKFGNHIIAFDNGYSTILIFSDCDQISNISNIYMRFM